MKVFWKWRRKKKEGGRRQANWIGGSFLPRMYHLTHFYFLYVEQSRQQFLAAWCHSRIVDRFIIDVAVTHHMCRAASTTYLFRPKLMPKRPVSMKADPTDAIIYPGHEGAALFVSELHIGMQADDWCFALTRATIRDSGKTLYSCISSNC